MKSALQTLKLKKVWIPLAIFFVFFLIVVATTYFLSQRISEVFDETNDLPLNDIVLAAIDPEKNKHLMKAEVAFFEAEKYDAQRKYLLASERMGEAADSFAAATDTSSPLVCIVLIRQASMEIKADKLDQAEATLQRALAGLPKGEKSTGLTFTVNRWLGYALQQHCKYRQAIQVFTSNIALGVRLDQSKHLSDEPNHRMALSGLSKCYIEAKEYDNASKSARELLDLVQKLPGRKDLVTDAWIELGRIKKGTKKYSQAIDFYDKALAVDSKCIEAYRARGIAFNEMKQYSRSISDFSLCINLNNADQNAYVWRAYEYELNGERDKAIGDLTAATKLDSADESVYDSRARLLALAGRYKEAIADYGQSLELDENGWTYLYRAQAYDQLGQQEEAIADYTRALQDKYFSRAPNTTAGDKSAADIAGAPKTAAAGKGVVKTEITMAALVYVRRAKCYERLGKSGLAAADRARSKELDSAKPEPVEHEDSANES